MKAVLYNGKNKVSVNFSKGEDISIPLSFNGDQPSTYNVVKATAKAYKDDQFIGDTRKGGPCNFETYQLTPHCNGTHTAPKFVFGFFGFPTTNLDAFATRAVLNLS